MSRQTIQYQYHRRDSVEGFTLVRNEKEDIASYLRRVANLIRKFTHEAKDDEVTDESIGQS